MRSPAVGHRDRHARMIGVFLSWLFGILDFRQALWVVVAIAGIAAAPTIVAAIWTT